MATESINTKLQERAERIKDFFKVDTSEDDFSFKKPVNTEDALKKIILPFVPSFSETNSLPTLEEDRTIESLRVNHDATKRIFFRDGKVNITTKKMTFLKLIYQLRHPFQTLVTAPWGKTIAYIWIYYLTSWTLFSLLYYFCPGECLSDPTHSFSESFVFSLQTQATIGYGETVPTNTYAYIVFTLQCLVSLIMDATLCGIFFAKFANPSTISSAILFSKRAVICKKDGKYCFILRVANMRKHALMGFTIRLYFVTDAQTKEGEKYIKFIPMKHNIEESVFVSGLPLSVIHVIDEESPIFGFKEFPDSGEVIVLLEGADASTSKSSQARFSYTKPEVAINYVFKEIVHWESLDGNYHVEYGDFHTIIKVN